MKYFLHDTNSFDDEKITELYIKFGYEGLGLFYTLLEKIAKQEKPIKTSILKNQLNVKKRLEKCWSFMEEIELISSRNGDTFNENLLNYSEMYQIKKENTRKKVLQWRKKQIDIKNVTGYVPICNHSKVKESKVKESKIKENNKRIDFDFSFLDEKWTGIFFDWIEYKKSIKNNYTTQKSIEACYRNLQSLSRNDLNIARRVIDQSIGNRWKGLFPLKETPAQRGELHVSTKYIRNESDRK